MTAAFVTWKCAAPENNPLLTNKKRYEGVGGHLFAIAAHRSMAYGLTVRFPVLQQTVN